MPDVKVYALVFNGRVQEWFAARCLAEAHAKNEGVIEYKVIEFNIPAREDTK